MGTFRQICFSWKGAIVLSAIVLFGCSSLRHWMYCSTAYDLAIFDRALYGIARENTSFSSILGFHILADHAAFILYPLSLFYKIYPSVYLLLGIQAIALASGAIPAKYMADRMGLTESQSQNIAILYLFYPLVFNIGMFDFHPDIFALPAFLWAIYAAKKDSLWLFIAAIATIASCKEILCLAVASLGIWLGIVEKKRLYGTIAIVIGILWFVIDIKFVIPYFGGENANLSRHLYRYATLGNSFGEIVVNIAKNPAILFSTIFTSANSIYLCQLWLPFAGYIHPKHLLSLIGAFPILAANILATSGAQKDILHQYSIAVLPFLIVAIVKTIADGKKFPIKEKLLLAWTLLCFAYFSKFFNIPYLYLSSASNLSAAREAIAQIRDAGSVMTNNNLSPQLPYQNYVEIFTTETNIDKLAKFQYILLDRQHPGFMSSAEAVDRAIASLKQMPDFKQQFLQDDIFLFKK
jgi:uncharacterized membrane protein